MQAIRRPGTPAAIELPVPRPRRRGSSAAVIHRPAPAGHRGRVGSAIVRRTLQDKPLEAILQDIRELVGPLVEAAK